MHVGALPTCILADWIAHVLYMHNLVRSSPVSKYLYNMYIVHQTVIVDLFVCILVDLFVHSSGILQWGGGGGGD